MYYTSCWLIINKYENMLCSMQISAENIRGSYNNDAKKNRYKNKKFKRQMLCLLQCDLTVIEWIIRISGLLW